MAGRHGFTCLTNAFSQKCEDNAAAAALHSMRDKVARVYRTHAASALAAVSDHVASAQGHQSVGSVVVKFAPMLLR